jgi:hypothetical protein
MSTVVDEAIPRAAVVIGPPGIGKSRLRHELCRRSRPATRTARSWWVRRSAERRSPYMIARDALRRLAGIGLGDQPAQSRALIVARRVAREGLLHAALPWGFISAGDLLRSLVNLGRGAETAAIAREDLASRDGCEGPMCTEVLLEVAPRRLCPRGAIGEPRKTFCAWPCGRSVCAPPTSPIPRSGARTWVGAERTAAPSSSKPCGCPARGSSGGFACEAAGRAQQ